MKFLDKQLILVVIFTLCYHTVTAQVTIGSKEPPRSGALLDLKENNNASSNANKGLGVPRVHLTNIDKLYPMFKDDNKYKTDPTYQQKVNENHVALIVYNTNVCLQPSIPDIGISVWDGSNWENLGGVSSTRGFSSEVETYYDQENQTFKARRFGNAGVWMLQNVRTKIYADGTSIGTPGVTWGYPTGAATISATDDSFYKKVPEIGYGYRDEAIFGSKDLLNIYSGFQGSELEGATHELASGKGRRGVCPYNWHIPTDVEWNNLEEEIAKNPKLYSYEDREGDWNPEWRQWRSEYSSTRGSHGNLMKAPCMSNNFFSAEIWFASGGTSLPISAGGFSLYLLNNWGYFDEFLVAFPSSSFSKITKMSSSPITYRLEFIARVGATILNEGILSPSNNLEDNEVSRILFTGNDSTPFSVRCVKDEP